MSASQNQPRVLREQAHLLDLMLDAIILRDMQGAIIFWNHGAEKLLGWTSDESLGKHANTLLHTQFPQPLEAIETEVLRAGLWEGELVHTRRDGTPLLVASRWAVWQQDHGTPLAIVEISADVTERKQVERSQRLLAEAGPVLSASLDATSRLANIAQVVVPLLADWCVVHVSEEGEPIQPVAVAHADPRKMTLANDLLRRLPPDPDVPPGAVHVLRTGRPDVVILDIRMPGGNGIEVLREVKKMNPVPKVIMLTNYAYAQYRKKCEEAGAGFFLDKSTEFDQLPQVLEQVRQGLRAEAGVGGWLAIPTEVDLTPG